LFRDGAEGAFRDSREICNVWAWNFDEEFDALLNAVVSTSGSSAVLALDMEFPGFLKEEPRVCAKGERYQALRENVDFMWPIQLGVAVASASGTLKGAWTFNLRFDADKDPSSASGMAFLRRVGVDFARHRNEGIPAAMIGRRLASSSLVGWHRQAPWWLTFSGSYDLGFLLKLLSCGRPLPGEAASFDKALSVVCPWRHELRDQLPRGSLEVLGKQHGIPRRGQAHTAGSDALLTLELFLQLEYAAYLCKEPWNPSPWAEDYKWDGDDTPWGPSNDWPTMSFVTGWDSHSQPHGITYAWREPAQLNGWPNSYGSSSDWYSTWGVV
jgi:CCR4-NOT transcription complex subunit 7/8